MTLLERIQRGEQAIAEAREQGREVPAEWQQHLAELKKLAFETTTMMVDNGVPVCWNCGVTMSHSYDIYGRPVLACWECAVTV